MASWTWVRGALVAKNVLRGIRHSIVSWQGRGLSRSVLHWGSLTSSPVLWASKILERYKAIRICSKGGHEDDEGSREEDIRGAAEVTWGDWRDMSSQSAVSSWGEAEFQALTSSLSWPVTTLKGTAWSYVRGGSGWILGKGSSSRGLLDPGTASPEKWSQWSASPQWSLWSASNLKELNENLDNVLRHIVWLLELSCAGQGAELQSSLRILSNSIYSMILCRSCPPLQTAYLLFKTNIKVIMFKK